VAQEETSVTIERRARSLYSARLNRRPFFSSQNRLIPRAGKKFSAREFLTHALEKHGALFSRANQAVFFLRADSFQRVLEMLKESIAHDGRTHCGRRMRWTAFRPSAVHFSWWNRGCMVLRTRQDHVSGQRPASSPPAAAVVETDTPAVDDLLPRGGTPSMPVRVCPAALAQLPGDAT
jgi:hypothetical protein